MHGCQYLLYMHDLILPDLLQKWFQQRPFNIITLNNTTQLPKFEFFVLLYFLVNVFINNLMKKRDLTDRLKRLYGVIIPYNGN